MSKITRGHKRMKTIDENKTADANEELKKKLRLEIRLLKLYIAQQSSGDTTSFKDIRILQIDNDAGRSKWNSSDILDVEAAIKNDLYTMAGFRCKMMGDRFIFAFRSSENHWHSDKNWIELFKIEEHWRLGKSVMPLSVDVQVIFDKYTIDSAASMKLFLRECKHTLDCYYRREYEYTKLKAFLQDFGATSVSLQTNYAYTMINLSLVKTVNQSPEEPRYIIVFLKYKKQEVLPCRVIVDCEGENPLSPAETKTLTALFKKVNDRGLKEVVEKILTSEGSPFFCKRDSEDICIIDEKGEGDSDGEISFLKILKKNSKPKKKQRKITSKNDENDNEVSADDDRRENDLSIVATDQSNAQSNEEDISQDDIPKTEKKKSRKASRKSSLKAKIKGKSKEKSKTSPAIGKKNLPSKNQNDDVIIIDENGGKETKFIVPGIFKPKAKQTKGFLEEINAADMQLQRSAKRIKKSGNREKKKSLPVEISAVTPANRSRVQLTCSTPIVGRPTNLSTVARENISAIATENVRTATEITGIEEIQDSDESDLDEFDSEDITKVENSQRELLKDLQAVKDTATVTKKPSKRKLKSLAGGKSKVARK